CWVPNNKHMAGRHIADNNEDALAYLRAITDGKIDEDRLVNYITESQKMAAWLEEKTHVQFDALEKYTDYYDDQPGARKGGRSMECPPFDGSKLGEDFHDLRRPHPQSVVLGMFQITARQAHLFLGSKFQTIIATIVLMF